MAHTCTAELMGENSLVPTFFFSKSYEYLVLQEGRTALHHTCASSKEEIMKALLSHADLDINAADKARTSFMYASTWARVRVEKAWSLADFRMARLSTFSGTLAQLRICSTIYPC